MIRFFIRQNFIVFVIFFVLFDKIHLEAVIFYASSSLREFFEIPVFDLRSFGEIVCRYFPVFARNLSTICRFAFSVRRRRRFAFR